MGKHQPNHRHVKIHRTYTVEETARLLGKHKNTVREWVKAGLSTINDRRPTLILGRELIAFLKVRREKKKRPCGPGQMYCVRCRALKFPGAGMVDYRRVAEKVGNLTAICPDCTSLMNRRVSLAKINEVRREMDITFPQALRHIREISQPTVNSDLR
jgi:hypothetical protein